MKAKLNGLSRVAYSAIAIAVIGVGLLPALSGKAAAAGQVQSRNIKMSSSTVNATSQTYLVSFTTATTQATQGVVVDFCDDYPIIASPTCTLPAGFSVGTPTVTVGGTFNVAGSWVAAIKNNGFVVSNASNTSVASGATATLTLTTATNPNTANHTFYARIYTYATAAAATSYTVGTPGAYVDYGGVAMSTANLISVTAKVQESMTFCVSGAALQPTNLTCTSATAANLTLGHGTPATLDATAVDTALAYTQLSTNAQTGASIRMKSSNTCADGGLSSNGGTTCNIVGAGTSATTIGIGNALFGLNVAASVNNTGGTGTITPTAPYSTALNYAMQPAVVGLYGDQVASSAAPTSLSNNILTFAASAALTTQAGVYTNNESMIATGTF